LIKYVTSALTLLVLLGCARTPADPAAQAAQTTPPPAAAASTPEAQAPEAAPPKPVPAELPDPVARVNGETIGRGEFERAIRTIEGRAGGPVPAERRDEIFRGVLDQMVAVRLLTQESTARHIVVSDTDVDSRFAQIRQQFPTEQAFTQALSVQQMTTDALKRDIRHDLAVSQLIESVVEPSVALGATEVKDFYDQNPDRFKEPESVRASHILIRVAPDATEEAKQKARAEAESVLKQLKAGADFAQLAKEHSQDGSAAQGGDLNFFTKDQMVPAFADAAFALKKDEISDIVETQFGLHIIKLTDRRAARTVPLSEVQDQIKDYLVGQKREAATSAFVASLKTKGKVEILF
jgi:peptidyl-prolyl cis-trans isomerase C